MRQKKENMKCCSQYSHLNVELHAVRVPNWRLPYLDRRIAEADRQIVPHAFRAKEGVMTCLESGRESAIWQIFDVSGID